MDTDKIMHSMTFLFAAYAAIWTGLFIFLLQIGKRLTSVQRDLKILQQHVKRDSGS